MEDANLTPEQKQALLETESALALTERRKAALKDAGKAALKTVGSALISLGSAAIFGYVLGSVLKSNAPKIAEVNVETPEVEA
jgi:hypothetical protein